MKRREFFAATAAAAAGTVALAAPALAQGTFRWRMANLYPRGVSFGIAYEAFTKKVEAATGGRLIIENVYDGGDHDIVIGRVQGLGLDRDEDGPLLFFKGSYGKLAPLD